MHFSLSQPFIQEIISVASASEISKLSFPTTASLKARQAFGNVLTINSGGNVNVVSGYYSAASKDQLKDK